MEPDPVVIDGTTEPDFVSCSGGLVVEIDGSLAGAVDGLRITAGGSTLRGLAINRFTGTFERHLGGYYKLRELPPGRYDVELKGGAGQRPQLLQGVEIRPGTSTVLDLSLTRGEDVEEISHPRLRFRKYGEPGGDPGDIVLPPR